MIFSVRKNQARLAREINTVPRSPEAPLKVVLCYPSRYSVGMANLGFQRVYELFNQGPGVYCDRAFFPDPRDEQEHFAKQAPVYSMESRRPLGEFDVIAFSFTFELDYVAALEMLRLCKVPLRSEQRRKSGRRKKYPLVMAGGIAVSANPEPMADFLDLIVIGEAEPLAAPLLSALAGLGRNFSADELREAFAGLPGVYVPSAYALECDEQGIIRSRRALPGAPERVQRAVAGPEELPSFQKIFSPDMEFSELGLIELMRGCRRGCRFCLEGYFYRPAREAALPAVISAIEKLREHRAKLGLIAAVVPDYTGFSRLMDYLARENVPFSVSSLRIEAVSERLVALLKKSGNKTITLAPETGSARVKCLVNKEISEERVVQGMKIVGKYGFERVKLYYQVGFPEETVLEVDAVIDSARRIQNALAEGSGRPRYSGKVELGINPFVPKAWTAFQWVAMAGKAELDSKLSRIRDRLGKEPGFVLKPGSVRESLLQGIISRGDRSLSVVLEQMAADRSKMSRVWRDPQILARYLRSRPLDEILPWDVIDPGVKKAYLQRELERGVMGKVSPGCRDDCRECGVC